MKDSNGAQCSDGESASWICPAGSAVPVISVTCSASNCRFDPPACTATVCGDGTAEGTEDCDWGSSFCGGNGDDPAGSTCDNIVFCAGGYPSATGKYRCKSDCSGFVYDTSVCSHCGDGVVQGTEDCEAGGVIKSDCPIGYERHCTGTCTWGDCVLSPPIAVPPVNENPFGIWEPMSGGGIIVGNSECYITGDGTTVGCSPGEYCGPDFRCYPCPGPGCGPCAVWDSAGGCTCQPANGGDPCGGGFCSGGSCVSCAPAGGSCALGCCAGLSCDGSYNVCMQCDPITHTQTNPPLAYGGSLCEKDCGASAICDELPPGTFVGGGACNAQCQWVDGDTSPPDCATVMGGPGYWNIGGEIAPTTCCGDDLGEFKRARDCASGACTTDLTDDACCKESTKCVFGSTCYYDIAEALTGVVTENTLFCTALSSLAACTTGDASIKCQWTGSSCVAAATRAAVQLSQSKGGSYVAYADVKGDGSQEVCVAASPGVWNAASGTIAGIVRNVSTGDQCNAQCPAPCIQGCPVVGATVKVLGTTETAITAADGSYQILGAKIGTFDITAAKTGYDAATDKGITVYDGATATANFVLTQSLGGNCNDDCTKIGTNVCDASCQGKGLCWFDSDETKAACDGTFGLTELPGGRFVDCCTGKAYTPVKAQISVPSSNVVTSRRLVLYKGKFVNMVVVVFNR